MKARISIAEMMRILCNIEPNAGDHSEGQSGHQGVDWSIVLKLNCFTGKLSEGYAFMQSFKSIMNNLPNKINTFGALLEGKVLTWFGQNNFQDFVRLEEEFLKT